MKKSTSAMSLVTRVTLCVLIISVCGQPDLSAADFEQPPVLSASALLEPKIMQSEVHQVDEKVQNDGLFNNYTVTSPFGEFSANSTQSLRFLVNEIGAIGAMRKVETDDTAIESLKQSGKNTVEGIENLVTDPQATLEGAASGIGSIFNRAKNTIGSREVSETEDSKVEQLIGFSKSKGEIATSYGVNVYSRNKLLQDELDRLAWADYLGGLGVGVATSVIPGVGGIVMTTSGTARLLNEAINTTPASELWLQNKNKLLAMDMNEDTVELFLNNPVFSPALSTVLTTALESMETAQNRELFLKVALQANEPRLARVITEIAVMSAGYHKHIAELASFATMARILRAEKKDGSVVLLIPSDHAIWGKRFAENASILAQEAKSDGAGLEIWTMGDFSEVARKNLTNLGYQTHERVRDQLIPIAD